MRLPPRFVPAPQTGWFPEMPVSDRLLTDDAGSGADSVRVDGDLSFNLTGRSAGHHPVRRSGLAASGQTGDGYGARRPVPELYPATVGRTADRAGSIRTRLSW
ncbi:hypothetical protein [Micromonospora sp. NPDC004704]